MRCQLTPDPLRIIPEESLSSIQVSRALPGPQTAGFSTTEPAQIYLDYGASLNHAGRHQVPVGLVEGHLLPVDDGGSARHLGARL